MPPLEDVSGAPSVPRSPASRLAHRTCFAAGQQIGGVIVDALVGRGGMSEVYRVHHAARGTTLALKILDPAVVRSSGRRYQQSLFARLRREGRLQQSIRHPNIVVVETVIETYAGPALLMEWVDGPGLDTLLEQRHGLTWADVDDIAIGLMTGLVRAQQAGIVHRDVKPGNVRMARVGGRWIPKLTDFGLAKQTEDADELTQTGQVMGTPGYMPPRQMVDAKHVDATVDTYALGAVLYELTTGRRMITEWGRFASDRVDLALRDLQGLDVPERMKRAITMAVASSESLRDASAVLACWHGTLPESSSRWRSWVVLGVLLALLALWFGSRLTL